MRKIELDKIVFPISRNKISFNKSYYNKTVLVDGVEIYNLNYKYFEDTLGLMNIRINKDNAIITLSGKILSDTNDLGAITKDNYNLIFDRLNKTNIVEVEPLEANEIQVFACDVKKDILVSNVNKSLFGINKHLEMLSDKYNITKHKDLSIFLKSYSKSCKDTLCIYRKYDELIKHNNKKYLEKIGREYLEQTKNLIRIERRLSSFEAIRRAFNIIHEGNIYLNEILYTDVCPIVEKFNDLKLTEEFIV